jgi:hypothetical protein
MSTTTQPTPDLDTAIAVTVGQLLSVTDPATGGTFMFRATRYCVEAAAERYYGFDEEADSGVPLIAECRSCAFTAEGWSEDDQSGFDFRVWNHEQTHPGHIVTTRAERD